MPVAPALCGLLARVALGAAVLGGVMAQVGCEMEPEPVKKERYAPIGLREGLPPFLKDTILERTDLHNMDPVGVTSFGLLVNLRHSGDSKSPPPVREWMLKEMYRHGIGRPTGPEEFRNISPEQMLADRRNAIVMVGGFVPPGARRGQRVDVVVQALPGDDTGSLAGGTLYDCDLRVLGIRPDAPGSSVNTYIRARGPVFINPSHALQVPSLAEPEARERARMGTVLGGGVVAVDRPIYLRLRLPSWNLSRALEAIINSRFQAEADKPRANGQGLCAAEAQDEGYLHLYVPKNYEQDLDHYVRVVQHLYIGLTPATAAAKARELCDEALKPDAPLDNITYALEGLDKAAAVPALKPLLLNPRPEVRWAAARAGAFLGDADSEDALIRMATVPGHPFRLHAIRALGQLPYTTAIGRGLTQCLDAEETLVRVEAYKGLSRHAGDPASGLPILPHKVGAGFTMDIIDCKGPPLIYASRLSEPRLAVFGRNTAVRTPVTFSAFDTALTITTNPSNPQLLSIFYRGEDLPAPVSTASRPLVIELAARLGGSGDDRFRMRFGYGEVVGMLQTMADSGKVASAFVLQDLPGVEAAAQTLWDATDAGRPVGMTGSGEDLPALPAAPPAPPPAGGAPGDGAGRDGGPAGGTPPPSGGRPLGSTEGGVR